jgi:hypothetical protein
MPQFDFFSFFVHIFWLTIASFTFYLIYLRYFLKNTSEVIKIRQNVVKLLNKGNVDTKALWNKSIEYFNR